MACSIGGLHQARIRLVSAASSVSALICSAYDLDRHVSCLRDFGRGKKKRRRRKIIGGHALSSADWMESLAERGGVPPHNMRGTKDEKRGDDVRDVMTGQLLCNVTTDRKVVSGAPNIWG